MEEELFVNILPGFQSLTFSSQYLFRIPDTVKHRITGYESVTFVTMLIVSRCFLTSLACMTRANPFRVP